MKNQLLNSPTDNISSIMTTTVQPSIEPSERISKILDRVPSNFRTKTNIEAIGDAKFGALTTTIKPPVRPNTGPTTTNAIWVWSQWYSDGDSSGTWVGIYQYPNGSYITGVYEFNEDGTIQVTFVP